MAARRHRPGTDAAAARVAGGTVTFRLGGQDYECRDRPFSGAAVPYEADGGEDRVNGAYWRAVEAVACPKCVSSGGVGCTRPNGGYSTPHAARVARAEQLGRVLSRGARRMS